MAKSSIFHFQQFDLVQEKASQKIGTDSLLLGAWAPLSEGEISVLDVGTGTGVLALMIAQRYPLAKVDGIDIEENAFREASINFKQSPFASRLAGFHVRLQDFSPGIQYDHVITNPPYFENSLFSGNTAKTLARHTISLPLKELIVHAKRLLSPKGTITLIVPHLEAEKLFALARENGFFLYQRGEVFSKPSSKKPIRILLQMGLEPKGCNSFQLLIRNDDNSYSDDQRALLSEFLTIFKT